MLTVLRLRGNRRVLAGLALAALLVAGAAGAIGRLGARDLLVKGKFAEAAVAYSSIAGGSQDPEMLAEYGYALAAAGYADPGLAQLDRAFLSEPMNAGVRFLGARALTALGMEDAAKEMGGAAPAWLVKPVLPDRISYQREMALCTNEAGIANMLLAQKRYMSAVVRFARLAEKCPGRPGTWSGYAIALEKLGAFKAAAHAVGKDLEAGGGNADQNKLKGEYRAQLESRSPIAVKEKEKPNNLLSGKYYTFLGGSYSHSGEMGFYNLSGRTGKFLTNNIDVSVNAGVVGGYDAPFKDYNGFMFGVTGRLGAPLPIDLPINANLGAKLAYAPAPKDNTSFILSPGLSFFIGGGSIDAYFDLALTGPLKDTKSLSIGYTMYFGGPGK